MSGHIEIVKLLLGGGADINKADNDDRTPLWKAARKGHFEIVKLLLDSGVDPNKASKYGVIPLNCAAYNGDIEIAKLLLDSGADIHKADADGNTPLYIASNNGHVEIVKLLLDATYNDIADKVLVAVSQQNNIIFDTAFIIFKKTVKDAITIDGFNIDELDTHKKLYNVFQAKFSQLK
jgi:ankyrin repeat protein